MRATPTVPRSAARLLAVAVTALLLLSLGATHAQARHRPGHTDGPPLTTQACKTAKSTNPLHPVQQGVLDPAGTNILLSVLNRVEPGVARLLRAEAIHATDVIDAVSTTTSAHGVVRETCKTVKHVARAAERAYGEDLGIPEF